MSILKLANELDDKHKTKIGDYLVPSVKAGTGLGTVGGAVAGSGVLNGKKPSLKGAAVGSAMGAAAGLGAGAANTIIAKRLNDVNKAVGNQMTLKTDGVSDDVKAGIGASVPSALIGGAVGKRLQTVGKLKRRGAAIGAGIGGTLGGASSYGLEKSVQKHKRNREDKKARREEYQRLMSELNHS